MAKPEESRPFTRRRPPSRQATRLMLFSALAAVGLAAVLAFFFLPPLLFYEDQPKGPHYQLGATLEDGTLRVRVDAASLPRPLGAFEVLLAVNNGTHTTNHTFGPLPEGIEGLVSFTDANGNGVLDAGDYFLLAVEPGTTYTFLILPVDREEDRGVGRLRWP